MAARLSIMRAVRQLAIEANVHVTVRAFSVINQALLRTSNPLARLRCCPTRRWPC